jgi:hypothetical protein
MLYSKGQNAKPGQSGQKKYRKLQRTKRIPMGHGNLSLLSVVCYQVDVFAIPRPEEFYQLWCVIFCDLETSRIRRSLDTELSHHKNQHERINIADKHS